jgi:hypothetical protein
VSSAHALSDESWCSADPSLKTCIVSVTRDGAPILASDATYDVYAITANVSGARKVLWGVDPTAGGSADLSADLGHTFVVTIKTNVVPRVLDGYGTAETYARSGPDGGGSYTVTITGQPVEVTDQDSCSYPAGGPTCTKISAKASAAIFQGEIDDTNYKSYRDGGAYPNGFVDSFYGMDMWTNIAETGLPPNLIEGADGNELELDLTDHHFEHDGTTLVKGEYYLRIPASFLSTYWGINDPSTLSTGGLAASIGAGGGTLTVTVEPGNAGVQVKIANMTFSRRQLKIKLGKVTPRAPTHIKAKRLNGSSAKVTFTASKPRGQKVKGYQLSCRPSQSVTYGMAVTAKSKRSPLTVRGLVASRYRCTLRARSKAGYGTLSTGFTIRS